VGLAASVAALAGFAIRAAARAQPAERRAAGAAVPPDRAIPVVAAVRAGSHFAFAARSVAAGWRGATRVAR